MPEYITWLNLSLWQQYLHWNFEGLKSPLDILSSFAGGAIYGTPQLEQDIEELFALVQADVEHVFALIRSQGGFDPWQVHLSDFQY